MSCICPLVYRRSIHGLAATLPFKVSSRDNVSAVVTNLGLVVIYNMNYTYGVPVPTLAPYQPDVKVRGGPRGTGHSRHCFFILARRGSSRGDRQLRPLFDAFEIRQPAPRTATFLF
jgi:hypothetical protein